MGVEKRERDLTKKECGNSNSSSRMDMGRAMAPVWLMKCPVVVTKLFKLEALVQPEIQDLEGVSIRDLDCAAKIPYCSLSDSSLGRREIIKKRTSEGESGSAAMGKVKGKHRLDKY
ncbi:hypothetical protein TB2_006467 [Malus domestica]